MRLLLVPGTAARAQKAIDDLNQALKRIGAACARALSHGMSSIRGMARKV